jgi:hypothetical protein
VPAWLQIINGKTEMYQIQFAVLYDDNTFPIMFSGGWLKEEKWQPLSFRSLAFCENTIAVIFADAAAVNFPS